MFTLKVIIRRAIKGGAISNRREKAKNNGAAPNRKRHPVNLSPP